VAQLKFIKGFAEFVQSDNTKINLNVQYVRKVFWAALHVRMPHFAIRAIWVIS
jgi:hypothetical protein